MPQSFMITWTFSRNKMWMFRNGTFIVETFILLGIQLKQLGHFIIKSLKKAETEQPSPTEIEPNEMAEALNKITLHLYDPLIYCMRN